MLTGNGQTANIITITIDTTTKTASYPLTMVDLSSANAPIASITLGDNSALTSLYTYTSAS